MESRADMLTRHEREISQAKERHARELAELDSRRWEELFTEDPWDTWKHWPVNNIRNWMEKCLPTIIRKREKIGIEIRNTCDGFLVASWKDPKGFTHNYHTQSGIDLLTKLAGRTLAPGEKVEI